VSNQPKDLEARSRDARRVFWLQQYATAFTTGDKRTAALALHFAQRYKGRSIVATPKQEQQQRG
jgi:hypothetical protein